MAKLTPYRYSADAKEKIGFSENLSNAYIVNCVGYSNNEKNENNGFSYNLMLKNILYHIKGGLKRTPIMPAHPRTHLYRKYPPPGTLNSIQRHYRRIFVTLAARLSCANTC